MTDFGHYDPAVHQDHTSSGTSAPPNDFNESGHSGLDQFDPAISLGIEGHAPDPLGSTAPVGGVDGTPAADASYWFDQGANGLCAPSSAAMVIAELTHDPNAQALETRVAQTAIDDGLMKYDPSGHLAFGQYSGMNVPDLTQVLGQFGIPAHAEHGDLTTLQSYLDQGYKAIISVDAEKIWNDPTHDSQRSDHAVQITGIDTAKNVAYLNDTGQHDAAHGAEETVSLDVLTAAWSTGGNQMVVTDMTAQSNQSTTDAPVEQPTTVDTTSSTPDPFQTAVPDAQTTVSNCCILPIVLQQHPQDTTYADVTAPQSVIPDGQPQDPSVPPSVIADGQPQDLTSLTPASPQPEAPTAQPVPVTNVDVSSPQVVAPVNAQPQLTATPEVAAPQLSVPDSLAHLMQIESEKAQPNSQIINSLQKIVDNNISMADVWAKPSEDND